MIFTNSPITSNDLAISGESRVNFLVSRAPRLGAESLRLVVAVARPAAGFGIVGIQAKLDYIAGSANLVSFWCQPNRSSQVRRIVGIQPGVGDHLGVEVQTAAQEAFDRWNAILHARRKRRSSSGLDTCPW